MSIDPLKQPKDITIILTIDTCMNGCSVGLYHGHEDRIIAEKIETMTRGQAERLVPMIEAVLTEGAMTYQEIDAIAVTKGPGAFTGMRIGLATARSLAMVLKIPVIGAGTFDTVLKTYLIEEGEQTHKGYAVILETKRQDYYFQAFDCSGGVRFEPKAATVEEITNFLKDHDYILIGDACGRFIAESQQEDLSMFNVSMPSPHAIGEIAKGIEAAEYCSAPVYLRAPEIGVAKNPPRKLKA